jgi:hypothetical protein
MMKKPLPPDEIIGLLGHLVNVYQKHMDLWGDSGRETSCNDVASAYGLMAFDLVNLMHLVVGNVEQVIMNQKHLGDLGSFTLREVSDKSAEETAKDEDPLKWN